ncbi:MAG TPA: hypothetical protein PLQ11_06655 [Beijerinckiaceae bacterium]|nr:hypothetical protein [Beijerinckiaceae bacterium]
MRALATLLMFVVCAFQAEAYVADGHEYTLACNKDGFVLTSRASVTRYIEAGVSSRFVKKKEKIFLGKNCDAIHEIFGGGKWCWANGGFGAEFSGTKIWFPRQELICPRETDNHLGCNC